jgi:hypothetical protein
MSEPLTWEEFLHYFHHSHYKLQGIKNEIESVIIPDISGNEMIHDPVRSALQDDQQKALDEILKDLHDLKPDPNVILNKALANLSKVDERSFVLTNLLEAIKRGEVAEVVLRKYKELGLTNIDVDAVKINMGGTGQNLNIGKNAVPPSSPRDLGGFIQRLGQKLNKFALALMEIVVNAMKTIPMFVGVKPSIGMVGPVPSLSFELEGESMKLSELFDAMQRKVG